MRSSKDALHGSGVRANTVHIEPSRKNMNEDVTKITSHFAQFEHHETNFWEFFISTERIWDDIEGSSYTNQLEIKDY